MTEIPGVSQLADLASAAISYSGGDKLSGGLGLMAMIPIVGEFATPAKWTAKVGKHLDEGLEVVEQVGKHLDDGNDLAFGLADDLFNFAKNKNFKTYVDFAGRGFNKEKKFLPQFKIMPINCILI